MDTTHLVETVKFTMFAKVKNDEYLAVLDEGVRERMRDAHRSRKVDVNFIAIIAAGQPPDVKCYSSDYFK